MTRPRVCTKIIYELDIKKDLPKFIPYEKHTKHIRKMKMYIDN